MSAARAQGLLAKNEQVVTFTLVELLTQLVFVAMLLALVLRDEALSDVNPSAERLRALEEQIAQRDRRIAQLEASNDDLAEQLARERELVRSLLGTKGTTLPVGIVAISQEDADRYARLKRMLDAQQRDAARARAELAAIKGGRGGTDRPNCLVTSGYLLDVKLLADGRLAVDPAWDAGAPAATVPGLMELVQAKVVTQPRFGQLADRAKSWGADQEVPCSFRVIARRRHERASLYDRQLRTIEQRFYVARR